MSANDEWIPLDEAVPPPRPKVKEGTRDLKLVGAGKFAPRKIRWLWQPYLPLGKLSILAGPQGQGKSQLTNMLAGAVSCNALHPTDLSDPGDVVIISAEDDPNDTIAPRLAAVGADFNRIAILDVREADRQGSMVQSVLTLPDDGPALSKAITSAKPNVKLVILDPVASFLGGTDAHRNTAVRNALAPLVSLAEGTGAAVLCVTHLSKGGSGGGEPLDRVIDSMAFTALARSVLLFSADPDDDDGTRGRKKVVVIAKSNIAPAGEHGLKVEIEDAVVHTGAGEEVGTSRMVVTGKTDMTAADLLMPPDERSEQSEAQDFLRDFLSGGWRTSDAVAKAMASRFSKAIYWKARRAICGRPMKAPGEKFGSWWVGPRGTQPPWIEDPNWTPEPSQGSQGSQGSQPSWSNDESSVQGSTLGHLTDGPPETLEGLEMVETLDPVDPAGAKVHRLSSNGVRTAEARRALERMLGEADDDDEAF